MGANKSIGFGGSSGTTGGESGSGKDTAVSLWGAKPQTTSENAPAESAVTNSFAVSVGGTGKNDTTQADSLFGALTVKTGEPLAFPKPAVSPQNTTASDLFPVSQISTPKALAPSAVSPTPATSNPFSPTLFSAVSIPVNKDRPPISNLPAQNYPADSVDKEKPTLPLAPMKSAPSIPIAPAITVVPSQSTASVETDESEYDSQPLPLSRGRESEGEESQDSTEEEDSCSIPYEDSTDLQFLLLPPDSSSAIRPNFLPLQCRAQESSLCALTSGPLFAVSNTFGFACAPYVESATNSTLSGVSYGLVISELWGERRVYIKTDSPVILLSMSQVEELHLACLTQSGSLLVIDLSLIMLQVSRKASGTGKAYSAPIPPEAKKHIYGKYRNISWSPTSENTLLCLSESNSLCVLKLKSSTTDDDNFCRDTLTPVANYVSCATWNPDGTKIACAMLSCPEIHILSYPEELEPPIMLHLQPKNQPDDCASSFIAWPFGTTICFGMEKPTSNSVFFLIFSEDPTRDPDTLTWFLRPHSDYPLHFFVKWLPEWQILLVGSSISSDVTVLRYSPNEAPLWISLSPPEGRRVQLPTNENGEEELIRGMELLLSYPATATVQLPTHPVLVLYSSVGRLYEYQLQYQPPSGCYSSKLSFKEVLHLPPPYDPLTVIRKARASLIDDTNSIETYAILEPLLYELDNTLHYLKTSKDADPKLHDDIVAEHLKCQIEFQSLQKYWAYYSEHQDIAFNNYLDSCSKKLMDIEKRLSLFNVFHTSQSSCDHSDHPYHNSTRTNVFESVENIIKMANSVYEEGQKIKPKNPSTFWTASSTNRDWSNPITSTDRRTFGTFDQFMATKKDCVS
ncbi:hypothetical protein Pelo_15248 [Pelomyxa schiedti]|nr:hypothetical protein Pelo_15248 [Pelomyxa schiedti]